MVWIFCDQPTMWLKMKINLNICGSSMVWYFVIPHLDIWTYLHIVYSFSEYIDSMLWYFNQYHPENTHCQCSLNLNSWMAFFALCVPQCFGPGNLFLSMWACTLSGLTLANPHQFQHMGFVVIPWLLPGAEVLVN